MFRNLIGQSEVVLAPVFVLVLFFLIFVLAIFWVFHPKRKESYKKAQNLPFRDDV